MPGLLLHATAAMTCQHVTGQATIAPVQSRVLVMGQPVATIPPGAPTIAIAGCLFTLPGGKPQPCVTVRWAMPSARVTVMGLPAMLVPAPGPAPGICQSAEQVPQGAPIVGAMQSRVVAM
ncbi:hypothetical protein K4L06_17275 [Lysobacter sp. BMK333-48F3]|uniref:hypothetical protein n=1 Tax=Lysobacter sp. BMK333-48F3 TaxID=2867962 RepID=UPI001C8C5113|nr:hypothetical protein [Lysobacter sp. BMK333-48F3]MBX9403063.1 hypothetical protein [Lysobacter sp. BMK333-48F3]